MALHPRALFDGTRIYLVLRAQTGNFGGRQPLTIPFERGMTEPPLPALPKFHCQEALPYIRIVMSTGLKRYFPANITQPIAFLTMKK